jgi:hypothetical protein
MLAPGLRDPAFHLQQGEYLFPALTKSGSPPARPHGWWAEARCCDVAGFEFLRGAFDRGQPDEKSGIGDLKGALTCA